VSHSERNLAFSGARENFGNLRVLSNFCLFVAHFIATSMAFRCVDFIWHWCEHRALGV